MVEAVVEFDYTSQEPDELTIRKGNVIQNIIQMPGGWWEGALNGKRGLFPDNFVKVRVDKHNVESDMMVNNQPASIEKKLCSHCKVLFSYSPTNDDELELAIDDVIEVLAEIEEGWWQGMLKGKVGVFPSNFVAPLDDDSDKNDAVVIEDTKGKKKVAQNRRSMEKGTASHPSGENEIQSVNNENAGLPQVPVSANRTSVEVLPELPPKPVREQARVLFPYESQHPDELTLAVNDIITILSKEVEDAGWWRGELKGKSGVFPDNFVEIVKPVTPSQPNHSDVDKSSDSHGKHKNSIGGSNSSPSSIKSSSPLPSKDEKDVPTFSAAKMKNKQNSPNIDSNKGVATAGDRRESASDVDTKKQTPPISRNAPSPTSKSSDSIDGAHHSTPLGPPATKKPVEQLSFKKMSPFQNNEYTNIITSKLSSPTAPSKPFVSPVSDSARLPVKKEPPSRPSPPNQVPSSKNLPNDVDRKTSKSSSPGTDLQSNSAPSSANHTPNIDFDAVKRSVILTHPTVNRVKAPKRRLPSSAFTKDFGSHDMMNGYAENSCDVDHASKSTSPVNNNTSSTSPVKRRTMEISDTGGKTNYSKVQWMMNMINNNSSNISSEMPMEVSNKIEAQPPNKGTDNRKSTPPAVAPKRPDKPCPTTPTSTTKPFLPERSVASVPHKPYSTPKGYQNHSLNSSSSSQNTITISSNDSNTSGSSASNFCSFDKTNNTSLPTSSSTPSSSTTNHNSSSASLSSVFPSSAPSTPTLPIAELRQHLANRSSQPRSVSSGATVPSGSASSPSSSATGSSSSPSTGALIKPSSINRLSKEIDINSTVSSSSLSSPVIQVSISLKEWEDVKNAISDLVRKQSEMASKLQEVTDQVREEKTKRLKYEKQLEEFRSLHGSV